MTNNIRLERKNQQKLLKDVSKALQIPINTLSNYERGDREPKLETWKKLADYFGVDIGYLQGVQKYRNAQARKLEFDDLQNKLLDRKHDIDYADFINRVNDMDIDSQRPILEKTFQRIPETFQISEQRFNSMPKRLKLKLAFALQEILVRLLTTPNLLDLSDGAKEKYIEDSLDKLLIFISKDL